MSSLAGWNIIRSQGLTLSQNHDCRTASLRSIRFCPASGLNQRVGTPDAWV